MAEATRDPSEPATPSVRRGLFPAHMSREKRAVAIFGLSAGTALIVTGLTGSILLRRLRPSMLGAAQASPGVAQPALPAARPVEAVEAPQTGRFPPTRIREDLAGLRADFGALYGFNDAEAQAKLPKPAELGFSPALDALAALAIATALTFSAFGGGIWWSARAFGADSVRAISACSAFRRFVEIASMKLGRTTKLTHWTDRIIRRRPPPARQSLPPRRHRTAHTDRHPATDDRAAGRSDARGGRARRRGAACLP